MIEYTIERLSEENRSLLNDFSCVESETQLKQYNSKTRKRILQHSQDMDAFLHNEAFDDQEKGLSTTYLFVSDSKLLAYLSLCNDAIQLDFEEKADMQKSYTTEPAIKIARLAVANDTQGLGIGKEAIDYAVAVSQEVREYSGVVFLTLDCYQHRESYYSQFGFVRNAIQPYELPYDSPISMRLWIDDYLKKVASNDAVS